MIKVNYVNAQHYPFFTQQKDLSQTSDFFDSELNLKGDIQAIAQGLYNSSINHNLSIGTHIQLTLFNTTVEFIVDHIAINSEERTSFSASDTTFQHTLTIAENKGTISGSLTYDNRRYKFRSTPSGNTLIIPVKAHQLPDHPRNYNDIHSSAIENLSQNTLLLDNAFDTENLTQFGSESVFTVIVAYTDQFARNAGSIDAYMDLLELETNLSYTNSLVNTRVKIVHAYRTAFQETPNIYNDLKYFMDPQNIETAELHDLRDLYHADIMMLLTGNDYGVCGLAAGIGVSSHEAFAIAQEACAAGNYTFAHEIGHLFGARHITAQDSMNSPFSFGHGYCNPRKNTWHTIMAYSCPTGSGGIRIGQWSNPNVFIDGDIAGSFSRAFNAEVINRRAKSVANFRIEPQTVELKNHVVLTQLSALSGGELLFKMEVPDNASDIQFTMSGGTGDADLYVKFGSTPSNNDFDCRPFSISSTETCTMMQEGGTYYIRIKAFSSFSNISLVGSFSTPSTELTNNIALKQLSAATNDTVQLTFPVPDNAENIQINISQGIGDADLYVRFNEEPSDTAFDCRPYAHGNNERCSLTQSGGLYYIRIKAYDSFAGLNIVGRYTTQKTPIIDPRTSTNTP